MDIQTWLEEQFKPWQNAMKQREADRQRYGQLVKSNPRAVKHVVALIHAGNSDEAAAAWNALGFPVQLKAITLTPGGDWLEITATTGEKTALPMGQLLSVLQELLAA